MMPQDKKDWPSWAVENIEIVDPDPSWRQKGIQEIGRLRRLLAPLYIQHFEHIGSTAVEGLPAKAIIDIMAQVSSFDIVDEVAKLLREEQWHFVPLELDKREWRRFFIRVEAKRDSAILHRAAHLHLMLKDEPRWEQQLQFRDALRSQPELTQAYGNLKRGLALKHSKDREAYTKGKADFIRRALNGYERDSKMGSQNGKWGQA